MRSFENSGICLVFAIVVVLLNGSGCEGSVNVTLDGFLEDGKKIVPKGISYTAVPIGGDGLFTFFMWDDFYAPIHRRDIELISKLNADTVLMRGFGSSTAHRALQKKMEAAKIRIIAEFSLAPYRLSVPNLDWRLVTQDIVRDFRDFVLFHRDSPATLMYSIETLVQVFNPTLDIDKEKVTYFFTGILPVLQQVRNQLEAETGNFHPIGVEIYANRDGALLMKDWGDVAACDLWLVSGEAQTPFGIHSWLHENPANRSVVVMLGSSAWSNSASTEDETAQATDLLNLAKGVFGMPKVIGIIFIELYDQWWKTSFSGQLLTDCDEERPFSHSPCGWVPSAGGQVAAGADVSFVSPEYMGLAAQFDEFGEHCVRPRGAFSTVAALYDPATTPRDPVSVAATDLSGSDELCAVLYPDVMDFPEAWFIVGMVAAAVIVLTIVAFCFARSRQLRHKTRFRKKYFHLAEEVKPLIVDKDHDDSSDDDDDGDGNRKIRKNLSDLGYSPNSSVGTVIFRGNSSSSVSSPPPLVSSSPPSHSLIVASGPSSSASTSSSGSSDDDGGGGGGGIRAGGAASPGVVVVPSSSSSTFSPQTTIESNSAAPPSEIGAAWIESIPFPNPDNFSLVFVIEKPTKPPAMKPAVPEHSWGQYWEVYMRTHILMQRDALETLIAREMDALNMGEGNAAVARRMAIHVVHLRTLEGVRCWANSLKKAAPAGFCLSFLTYLGFGMVVVAVICALLPISLAPLGGLGFSALGLIGSIFSACIVAVANKAKEGKSTNTILPDFLKDTESDPAAQYAQILVFKSLVSASESVVHCPERLAQLFVRGWVNKREFWLSMRSLHRGLSDMARAASPDNSENDGINGINFEDINDAALWRVRIHSKLKTWREPAGAMVVLDILAIYHPIVIFHIWVYVISLVIAEQGDIDWPRVVRADALASALGNGLFFLWVGCRDTCGRLNRERAVSALAAFFFALVGNAFSADFSIPALYIKFASMGYSLVRLAAFFLWNAIGTRDPAIPGSDQHGRKIVATATTTTTSTAAAAPSASVDHEEAAGVDFSRDSTIEHSQPSKKPRKPTKEQVGMPSNFGWNALYVAIVTTCNILLNTELVIPMTRGVSYNDLCVDTGIASSGSLLDSATFSCIGFISGVWLLIALTMLMNSFFIFNVLVGPWGYIEGSRRGVRHVRSPSARFSFAERNYVKIDAEGALVSKKVPSHEASLLEKIFSVQPKSKSWMMGGTAAATTSAAQQPSPAPAPAAAAAAAPANIVVENSELEDEYDDEYFDEQSDYDYHEEIAVPGSNSEPLLGADGNEFPPPRGSATFRNRSKPIDINVSPGRRRRKASAAATAAGSANGGFVGSDVSVSPSSISEASFGPSPSPSLLGGGGAAGGDGVTTTTRTAAPPAPAPSSTAVAPAAPPPALWKQIWASIVEELRQRDLVSDKELDDLLKTDGAEQVCRLTLESVRELLTFWLSSLDGLTRDQRRGSLGVGKLPISPATIPSIAHVIATYGEDIIRPLSYLRESNLDTTNPDADNNLEFLISHHHQEWRWMVHRLGKIYKDKLSNPQAECDKKLQAALQDSTGRQLKWFIRSCGDPESSIVKDIMWEVRKWASFRSQTVGRTLRGPCSHFAALKLLLGDAKTASQFCQVVIAHQQYGAPQSNESPANKRKFVMQMQDLERIMRESALEGLQIELAYDYVHNVDSNDNEKIYREFRQELHQRMNEYCERVNISRDQFVSFTPCWTIYSRIVNGKMEIDHAIPRRFPVRIGKDEKTQGKAGNQDQALRCVRSHVVQLHDANMDGFISECFKIPFITRQFLDHVLPGMSDEDKIRVRSTPKCRILGFREHVFTGDDGIIGRCMANMEFAFGTIFQRVLSTLGSRMHYGHPDYFDAFWAVSRGGFSKASKRLCLSEDVFAGFNVYMRRERIIHEDRLEWQKGRETSMIAASQLFFKFSEGTVGVLRSRDHYRIQAGKSVLEQFTLFYGTIGSYLNQLMIYYSIEVYVLAMLAATIAGVSERDLGVLHNVLGAEWLVSAGVVTALPLLCEFMLERGAASGLIQFVMSAPQTALFFMFQNRTIAAAVEHGILTGEAMYRATGRPDPNHRYSMTDTFKQFARSHFYPALRITLLWLLYTGFVEAKSGGRLPMYLIMILVVVWVIAPAIFCPSPTWPNVKKDILSFVQFLTSNDFYDFCFRPDLSYFGAKICSDCLKLPPPGRDGRHGPYNCCHDVQLPGSQKWMLALHIFSRFLVFGVIFAATYSSIHDYLWIFIALWLLHAGLTGARASFARGELHSPIVTLLWMILPWLAVYPFVAPLLVPSITPFSAPALVALVLFIAINQFCYAFSSFFIWFSASIFLRRDRIGRRNAAKLRWARISYELFLQHHLHVASAAIIFVSNSIVQIAMMVLYGVVNLLLRVPMAVMPKSENDKPDKDHAA